MNADESVVRDDKEKSGKETAAESERCCCYVIDPCGCYDPCGCRVDSCCC